MKAAFEDYVHKLTVFSAATGGAFDGQAANVPAALAESTEAVFQLCSAFGAEEGGRKIKKERKKIRIAASEIDHQLSRVVLEAPEPQKKSRPDVIARAQGKSKKRMSRRDRRKLGPEDEPGKIFGASDGTPD